MHRCYIYLYMRKEKTQQNGKSEARIRDIPAKIVEVATEIYSGGTIRWMAEAVPDLRADYFVLKNREINACRRLSGLMSRGCTFGAVSERARNAGGTDL